MTAMGEALRHDSFTLDELAQRYSSPIDMTAVALLNVLMELADTVQTFAGPMLVLPADEWTLAAINDVLTAVEDAEDDDPAEDGDPAEDDDPGGDVLDRGEADNADDEEDGTAEYDHRASPMLDENARPLRLGTGQPPARPVTRADLASVEGLPSPELARELAVEQGRRYVAANDGRFYGPSGEVYAPEPIAVGT